MIYKEHEFKKNEVAAGIGLAFLKKAGVNFNANGGKKIQRNNKRKKTIQEIHKEEEEDRKEQVCPLCSQNFDRIGDVAKKVPGTDSVYHEGCLKIWLTRRQQCPETLRIIEALEGEDEKNLKKMDLNDDSEKIDAKQKMDNNPSQSSVKESIGSKKPGILKRSGTKKKMTKFERKMKRKMSKVKMKRSPRKFTRLNQQSANNSVMSSQKGIMSP